MLSVRGIWLLFTRWAASEAGKARLKLVLPPVLFFMLTTGLLHTFAYDFFMTNDDGTVLSPPVIGSLLIVGGVTLFAMVTLATLGLFLTIIAQSFFPSSETRSQRKKAKARASALEALARPTREQELEARVREDIEELLGLRGVNVLQAAVRASDLLDSVNTTPKRSLLRRGHAK